MKILKNLKLRLLSTLFFILLVLFYSFGYILVITLETSYRENLEALLFSALKDSKHDFEQSGKNISSFDEVKEEFDIPVLFAQIVAYDSGQNQFEILKRSTDLKNETLEIEATMVQKIFKNPQKIIFSISSNPNLDQHKIYIGSTFLAQEASQILFMQCAIPYNEHTPQAKQIKTILWIGFPLLLIIILFLAHKLLQKSLSSIQKVNNTAKALRGSKEYLSIQKSHIAYEIDDLIETFNILLSELHDAYKQVKQFGQNASHELKTPLTIMKGEIDVGLRKVRSTQEYEKILHNVFKETNNLHEVIEKILFLSTTTRNDLKSNFSEIYLDEVLLDAIEEKRSMCKQKNIILHVSTLEAVNLRGNAILLKIALSNLIDNAIKYSNISSKILISLSPHKLSIQDEGIGIPQEELAHIFKQFYRCKTSKEKVHGSGLGLSIVQNIFMSHEFYINIQSTLGKGTLIIVTF